MAQVIYLPPSPSIGGAIGTALGNAANVGAKELLQKQQEGQSKKVISDIQGASNREEAFKLAADHARSPAEFLQLSQAAANFFPQTKPEKSTATDLLFTDTKTGEKTVHKVDVPVSEQSSADSLTKQFGQSGRYKVTVASSQDVPKDWVDSTTGDYLGTHINKPNDTAVPLDVAKFQGQRSKKGADNSAVFAPDGSLKTPAANGIRQIVNDFTKGTDPNTGFEINMKPAIAMDAFKGAVGYLKSGQEDNIISATTRALTDSMKAHPEANQLPLSPAKVNELRDRNFNYEEGVAMIDRNMLKLASSTGLGSAGKHLLNYIMGQASVLGAKIPFPDTARTRSDLEVMKKSLTAQLVDNPRIPVAEQDLARNLIPGPSDWFKAPEIAAQNMRSLRDMLTFRRRFVGNTLGVDLPDLPTVANTISKMSVNDLKDINTETLDQKERDALSKRLKELGY